MDRRDFVKMAGMGLAAMALPEPWAWAADETLSSGSSSPHWTA